MAVRVIRAAAGLGKTSMLASLLKDSLYGKVEIYVPTHDLGSHVYQLLGSMHRVAIQGRSQPWNDKQRMCARHEEAQILVSKGYPVYPVLCSRRDDKGRTESCEHYSACPYIAQFEGPEQVYVYTHASLPLERGPLEEGVPGLAVIDESFFRSCINQLFLSIPDLLSVPASKPHTQALCAAIVQALREGKPLLTEIRSRGLEPSVPLAIAENKLQLPLVSPYWPAQKQARVLNQLAPRPRLLELFETLRAELTTGRADSHALVLDDRNNAVVVHRRLPITRFTSAQRSSDVLILDADADPLLVAPWFPDAQFDRIPARRNAHVVQCVSTRCSTTALVPERNTDPGSRENAQQKLADLQALIDRKAADGRRVLVVGPQAITGNPAQKIPPLIQAPMGANLAHFGAIRGVDRWKSFVTAIIVGRNQPPLEAVEGLARAIWFDDPKPLVFASEWKVERRGYRVRGATLPTGVEVLVHPDQRVQAVLEQVREMESTQAIDRLRLVHAPRQKEVILLSNIPLDIDVDELRSWDEVTRGSRIEQAWWRLNGVMPLAPGWLAKSFPDLWQSADAAEADLRDIGKSRGILNGTSIGRPTVLTFRYRSHGQRRHSRALSVLPLNESQAELTRLMGNQPLVVAQLTDSVPGADQFCAVMNASFQPMDAEGSP